MFKRKSLQRFNIYLGLFAILLISVCPVINQTIELIKGTSSQQSITKHIPASNHFECAYEFLKANGLSAETFADNQDAHPNSQPSSKQQIDEHSLAKCGYCDLLHAATILVAFYIAVIETPASETIISKSSPFLPSLNYWSIRSRAPPIFSVA